MRKNILTVLLATSIISSSFFISNADYSENSFYNIQNSVEKKIGSVSLLKEKIIRQLKVNYALEKNRLGSSIEPYYTFDYFYNQAYLADGGIHFYIKSYFPNLSQEDILTKEIDFLNYLNINRTPIDNNEIPIEYVNYEIETFISKKNRNDLMKYQSKMTSEEKVCYYNFIEKNLFEILSTINGNPQFIVDSIYPDYDECLSPEQEYKLQEAIILQKNKIDKYIKEEKSISNGEKAKILNITKLIPKVPVKKEMKNENIENKAYRVSKLNGVLEYAKKHGYTNGYYGKGSWNSWYYSNNAPSPYINMQSISEYDCANFVSQCLHAGNIDFKERNSDEYNIKNWFWHNRNNYSMSWVQAKLFRKHWQDRVKSETLTVSKLSDLKKIYPGMPISLINTKNNEAYHTILATERHSDGYNFSFAAHTDTNKRTNLFEKLKNRTCKIYYIGYH